MNRDILYTNVAPAPVGPYSQGVRAGDFIFTAGQVGLDPATGKLAEFLEAQARQVLANLAAILTSARLLAPPLPSPACLWAPWSRSKRSLWWAKLTFSLRIACACLAYLTLHKVYFAV